MIKLDTSLTVEWQGFLNLDTRFELMGKRTHGDHLYLLFRNREIVKKDLRLVVLSNKTGEYSTFPIRNFIAFVPTEFQITSQAAIIGGYFNSIPVVIFYSFKTGMTKVLPGLLNESGELTQIKTENTGFFDVLITANNAVGQKTVFIKSYDADGVLISQVPLLPDENKHLIFARSLKTGNNTQLVAGTYGNRNSEYSRGIFIASISPNGMQQLRYYNYGDLENFFKYMNTRREQRVKNRIERRRIEGKRIRFNYRFIVHEIVPHKDQFVLLGEAFYPKYITVDRSYSGGFFNPFTYSYAGMMMRNGRIFDGYRYTHAVVMGFDKNGKLLWDNSFEVNDVKTFTLEQYVKLETSEQNIALFYAFDNQLRSKIIQGNEVVEGKTYSPLRTSSPFDVVRKDRSTTSKLDYWYDNYFLAFGVQEISNAQTGTRRVFFVNKISHRRNSSSMTSSIVN
jgi:hypothetical protein